MVWFLHYTDLSKRDDMTLPSYEKAAEVRNFKKHFLRHANSTTSTEIERVH